MMQCAHEDAQLGRVQLERVGQTPGAPDGRVLTQCAVSRARHVAHDAVVQHLRRAFDVRAMGPSGMEQRRELGRVAHGHDGGGGGELPGAHDRDELGVAVVRKHQALIVPQGLVGGGAGKGFLVGGVVHEMHAIDALQSLGPRGGARVQNQMMRLHSQQMSRQHAHLLLVGQQAACVGAVHPLLHLWVGIELARLALQCKTVRIPGHFHEHTHAFKFLND
mmetsp:Transcript_33627/g.63253  ORF Transcript_33627/g.63253 Transcript_33627/m.63253 type:complete len:220 (+) Transcript_33627:1610-2269(+)